MRNPIKIRRQVKRFKTIMDAIYVAFTVLAVLLIVFAVNSYSSNPNFSTVTFFIQFMVACVLEALAIYLKYWTKIVCRKKLLNIKIIEREIFHNKAVV